MEGLFRLSFYLLLLIGIKETQCVDCKYYPRYHLAPPQGWMNDPNGFCYYRGEYHMFYQHNPESSLEPGIAHWGHAVSKDLFHWRHLPIAMYPDKNYDITGVFSGSALIENDTMYLYYTGNVNKPPNHNQYQALGISTDGVHVTKYEGNPILIGEEHQPNIRDPKVWKHGQNYYMVLGNSFDNNTLGQVLLYRSSDKFNWEQVSTIGKSDGALGFMWECPDFFELNGKYILLFSPQGVEPDGDKYRNLYQTGYIVGDFDYDSLVFTPLTEFVELDHGHDFYATQTFEDKKGRRLLAAWFDMWENDYPQGEDGWHGMLTMTRELTLTDEYKLIQQPINEVRSIRKESLLCGETDEGGVTLQDKAGEVSITAELEDLEVIIESIDESAKVKISYDKTNGLITLDRGGDDGVRRTPWTPIENILKLRIYIDASSIEVFCGDGEVTFSSRFFPKDDVRVRLGEGTAVKNISVYSLKRTVVC